MQGGKQQCLWHFPWREEHVQMPGGGEACVREEKGLAWCLDITASLVWLELGSGRGEQGVVGSEAAEVWGVLDDMGFVGWEEGQVCS